MGTSLGIINNIRANASEDYAKYIPEATAQNIQQVGNALLEYTPLFNEFCEALIHKIGKTMLEQALFKNKLARFKSGTVLSGQDVEEIFVSMANDPEQYDATGPNPLGRREPSDVQVLYHRMNRRNVYVISIGDDDFRRAFRSEAAMDAFIKAQIQSVYTRAEYDEWLLMKELFTGYMDNFTFAQLPTTNPGDMATVAKDFVKVTRKLVQDMSFMSDKFNSAGVMTKTDPSQLVLFVNKDILAEVDVEVLAKSFNMGKTDFETRVISMDDFGSVDEQPLAVLADEGWFKVFDVKSTMETQRNAHGLFTNYFYHVWQILSASRFKNAVAIVPSAKV